MNLLQTAQQFATDAHSSINQRRKYNNEPYHTHCQRVVNILNEVTSDENILAAAWLHDVLEDVAPHNENFSAEKILQTFGPTIFDIVLALTDSKVEAGNRAARKELDRKRLGAASNEAKTVKLADLIDNLLDIKQHDIGFYWVIAKETGLLLPYLEGGNPILFARITKILEENNDKATHP